MSAVYRPMMRSAVGRRNTGSDSRVDAVTAARRGRRHLVGVSVLGSIDTRFATSHRWIVLEFDRFQLWDEGPTR